METNIPLTFAVNGTTSWIGYSLDNQANITVDGNTTLTGLSYGQHSIVVYANDTSGTMGVSKEIFFTRAIIVPDDFSTIQEAINAASDGDIIFVRNGTYYENVVVNKAVSLIGQDSNKTIVDGNGGFSAVSITAPYVARFPLVSLFRMLMRESARQTHMIVL